ncbi:MAG: hypothetical protein M3Y21_07785 [Candidatus Eremiobacteraeota bacterium]|nr:hypothetical protein [Candidatus Eremiobacteraeota bacterium]
MSDTFRPTPADHYGSGSDNGNGYKGTSAENARSSYEQADGSGDVGKTLLIGVLGGLISAAGFLVYQRLPEDQKERLQGQVKGMVAQRINEIRSNFNI